MIDFPELSEDPSKLSLVFCSVLYFGILAYYYKNMLAFQKADSIKKWIFLGLAFLAIICPYYAGDFVHYQWLVELYDGQELYHLEPLYCRIIEFTNHNYLAFRLIVWGTGVIALLKMFSNYGLEKFSSFFVLFAIYCSAISYARAGVATSVFFLGLSFLFCDHYNKIVRLSIGFVLMIASLQFHKSMIGLILITPAIFVPINKKTIVPLALVILVISGIMKSLIGDVADSLSSDDAMAEIIERSTIKKQGTFGAGYSVIGMIPLIWGKVIMYIPLYVSLRYLIFRQLVDKIPNSIVSLFRFQCALFLLEVSMFFMFGNMSIMYYRYEGMLFIPNTIMLCYLFQRGILVKDKFVMYFWICAGYMCYLFASFFI